MLLLLCFPHNMAFTTPRHFLSLVRRGLTTTSETTPSPLQQHIDELVEQGVTVLHTNTNTEAVEGWRKMASEIEQGLRGQAGRLGMGREEGFKEVFQSFEGNYHFPLTHLLPERDVRDTVTPSEFVFAEQKTKLVNETVEVQSQLMEEMSKHVGEHAHDLFCAILSDSYEKSGQGFSFPFFLVPLPPPISLTLFHRTSSRLPFISDGEMAHKRLPSFWNRRIRWQRSPPLCFDCFRPS